MQPKRTIACIIFAFLIPGADVPALDLTPFSTSIQGNEGPAIAAIRVTDGDTRYTFIPPGGWLADGGAKALTLTSSDHTQSYMKIMLIPKQDSQPAVPPQSDDQDTMNALEQWAAQFIPPGASQVAFVKMVPSPFLVDGRYSTELQFSFIAYGGHEMASVSILDFSPTERMIVLVSAGKDNFPKARGQAFSSMMSWQKMEAKKKQQQ